MTRLQQKSELSFKLARLFDPLLRLVESPERYDAQDRAETLARFFDEFPRLNEEFRAFCHGQTGHKYRIEFSNFFTALDGVPNKLLDGQQLESILFVHLAKARAAIDAVPVPATSVILEAGSPFSAYCRLRELCEADATTSLAWLDPYLDASIFHRYLAGVRPSVPVTLVTCEPKPGGSNRKRWDEFLDVSRLYAREHGPTRYTLVVQPAQHDRWAVFDGKRIYSLGGSAKDAGDRSYFTIAAVDPSPANVQRIQTQIATGSEYFGPSTPNHR